MKPGITITLWTVSVALATTACSGSPEADKPRFDTEPALAESIDEIPDNALAEPGESLANGWKVPQGTKLLGSVFTNPNTEADDEVQSRYAVAEVTVDPHDVLRDLMWQTEKLGFTPIEGVWQDSEYQLCRKSSDDSLFCGFEAADSKGRSRMQATIHVSAQGAPYEYSVLEMELFADRKSQDGDEKALKAKVKKPKGKAAVQPPEAEESRLKPGSTIPTQSGTLGALADFGEVPEGAYLLTVPFPYGGLGTSAMFLVTGEVESVSDALERMVVDECGTLKGDDYTREYDGTEYTYWHTKMTDKEAEPFGVLETWKTADDLEFAYLNMFCGLPSA